MPATASASSSTAQASTVDPPAVPKAAKLTADPVAMPHTTEGVRARDTFDVVLLGGYSDRPKQFLWGVHDEVLRKWKAVCSVSLPPEAQRYADTYLNNFLVAVDGARPECLPSWVTLCDEPCPDTVVKDVRQSLVCEGLPQGDPPISDLCPKIPPQTKKVSQLEIIVCKLLMLVASVRRMSRGAG